MTVILFHPRFVSPIRQGAKQQTIRHAARCRPGDTLSLRRWQGRPYRSPQEEIVPQVVCSAVRRLWVEVEWSDARVAVQVAVDGVPVEDMDAFARADGFAGLADMEAFYRDSRRESCEAVLIEWKEVSS